MRRTEPEAGPGPVARDGSPVEFYRRLPDLGGADLIHAAVPLGCAILELGCGAGRTTHRLVALGHPVTAVDNSPEMLAHVHGAEAVLQDIESLDLGRTFPAVVLASYLVNTADRGQRRAFLDTCSRHVGPEGMVLIQRAHPNVRWVGSDVYESTYGEVRIRTRVKSWEGNVLHAVAVYSIGDRTWTQEYRSELLDADAMEEQLARSGLTIRGWLGEGREWLRAARTLTDPSGPA
jgi:SAM-dependent methyltransferase